MQTRGLVNSCVTELGPNFPTGEKCPTIVLAFRSHLLDFSRSSETPPSQRWLSLETEALFTE